MFLWIQSAGIPEISFLSSLSPSGWLLLPISSLGISNKIERKSTSPFDDLTKEEKKHHKKF